MADASEAVVQPVVPQTITYEQLGYWYLRLNGFLTIPNFVVHPDEGSDQGTEIDVLGVRFPLRAENLVRPMPDDEAITKLATSEHRGEPPRIVIVIAEVKASACDLNDTWKVQEEKYYLRILRLVRATGVFSEEKSDDVAKTLQRTGTYSSTRNKMSLVCFGMTHSTGIQQSRPEVPQILWDQVLKFIFDRFWNYYIVKASHGQWDVSGRELWRIFAICLNEAAEGARNMNEARTTARPKFINKVKAQLTS